MTVLYRKYRPQSFADIAGQEHVKTVLTHEIASGRLAHSYLFTGPRGVGKTTTARIFAKALNCAARPPGSGEPCGKCESCVEIAAGRSLDVIEIDAASHTGVDNVREQVIESARFAPAKSARKIFIIDEVHMLSASAFNALLKTLEEPPSHAIFILATTELHKLPATVVSRCQRFDFRKIGRDELMTRLEWLAKEEGIQADHEVLEAVARQSEGCLRDAESLLSQLFSLGEKHLTEKSAALVLPLLSAETVCGLAASLLEKDVPKALSAWERLSESGADLARAVADLTDLFREMALSRLRNRPFEPPFSADKAWRERLEAMRSGLAPAQAAALIQRLVEVRDEMKRVDIPELPFELMVMEWAVGVVPGEVEIPKPDGEEPEDRPEDAFQEKGPEPVASSGASYSLAEVKSAWPDILRKAQEKHHSLPYMLGVAELLSCENGELVFGFQYALYRDRLNDLKHKRLIEEAVVEATGRSLRIRAVLVAQKTDGTVEPSPTIAVKPSANLPEGFADLVKEFGGTIV